jgi:hypothetical protein
MKTKLRFLFLSTNRTYINNSIQLFPLAIATFAEIDYFGPGFQSTEVLKKGVHDFAEKNGPYDMLMTDGVIFFYKNTNRTYMIFILLVGYLHLPKTLWEMYLVGEQMTTTIL